MSNYWTELSSLHFDLERGKKIQKTQGAGPSEHIWTVGICPNQILQKKGNCNTINKDIYGIGYFQWDINIFLLTLNLFTNFKTAPPGLMGALLLTYILKCEGNTKLIYKNWQTPVKCQKFTLNFRLYLNTPKELGLFFSMKLRIGHEIRKIW